MATIDNEEFNYALREIAIKAINFDNPYDRVRCTQWTKKLAQLPDDDIEISRIRNEYAQLLRIQIRYGKLHGIFKDCPPESHNLPPLAECLGNYVVKEVPNLPRVGPVRPIVQHHSPDGTAYVAAKQASGGVFCYMAVTPDAFR